MLTADVRIEEFDASDWIRLHDILARRGKERDESPKGGLVVVVDGERISRLVSTRRGRLDPSGAIWASPLGALAKGHGARWAVRLDRAVLLRLEELFARRIVRSDDLLGQALKLAALVRELAEEGLIETYPRDARALPIVKERLALRALDAACAPGKTILFAAFDEGDVWTSLSLHRGDRGFDRVVGPATARHEMGLVSGDWTRDSRGFSRAIELSVGPISLGCFAQTTTWERLLHDASPGAWAAAVAAREMLFHPVLPAVAIPLGVDIGRAAVAAARELAARWGVPSLLGAESPFRPAVDRARELAGSAEVERLLGFDPLALLSELLSPNR